MSSKIFCNIVKGNVINIITNNNCTTIIPVNEIGCIIVNYD